MERIFQKAQLLGADTSTKINDLFRQKVQYEDMLKDVEAQIHYARGVLDAVGELQEFIKQTIKQDSDREKFERDAAQYAQEHGGDGSGETDNIPSIPSSDEVKQ